MSANKSSSSNQCQMPEAINELDDARIQSNSIVFTPSSKQHREVSETASINSRSSGRIRGKIEKRMPGKELTSPNTSSLRKLDDELRQQISRLEEPSFISSVKHNPSKCKSIKLCQTVSVKKLRQAVINQEICSICLNPPSEDSGRLPCGHKFCFDCIEFCAKDTSNKCPYCRKEFTVIVRRGGEEVKIEPKTLHIEYDEDYIEDPCYVCNTFQSIPTLLLCDLCQNRCCHIECDPRIVNDQIPQVWKCRFCQILELSQQMHALDVTESIDNGENGANESADQADRESMTSQQRYLLRYQQRRHQSQASHIASRTRSKTVRSHETGEPEHVERGLMRTRQAARRRRS